MTDIAFEADVTAALVLAYVVEVLIAIWAYIGIVRLWRAEGGGANRIWTALVVMTGLAVAGAILTLPVAVVALLHLPRLPFTGAAITFVVMIQLAAVIVYRLVFEKIRRERGAIAPLPPAGGEKESDDDAAL
jgi:hypothetical protein